MFHGTGGDESSMTALGRTLSSSASLLSPRGKVTERGMNRFFRLFSEGVFDIEDLEYRTNELADFIIEAARRYELDKSALFAVGYSNGANIAATMLLIRPEVFSGALLFRPMFTFEPPKLPDLNDMKIMISAAISDEIVPEEETRRLAHLLGKANAYVDTLWNESGHSLTEEETTEAGRWLKENYSQWFK